jgi:hypothetical protein
MSTPAASRASTKSSTRAGDGLILFVAPLASTRPIRLRVTDVPSPDVRYGHPVLRSLGGDCATASMPPLVTYAGSRDTGGPKPPLPVDGGSGLHIPSRRAMGASAGRMPKRSGHAVSGGHGCPQRTSAERVCAGPSRVGRVPPPNRTGPGPCYPRLGGVNLIFLISSTTCPSCTLPETAVMARTTFTYLSE